MHPSPHLKFLGDRPPVHLGLCPWLQARSVDEDQYKWQHFIEEHTSGGHGDWMSCIMLHVNVQVLLTLGVCCRISSYPGEADSSRILSCWPWLGWIGWITTQHVLWLWIRLRRRHQEALRIILRTKHSTSVWSLNAHSDLYLFVSEVLTYMYVFVSFAKGLRTAYFSSLRCNYAPEVQVKSIRRVETLAVIVVVAMLQWLISDHCCWWCWYRW